MSDLRLAILGCGQIVRDVHLVALRRIPAVRIVALADSDSSRRDWAATQLDGATLYDDYRALLETAAFDAVLIALPTVHHEDAALLALSRGAHVYLEKPIATSLDEADAVVAAWERAGTIGRIGFNLRFNRLYRDLKSALRREEIGTPLAVRTSFTAPWPVDPGWHISAEQGGGALFELASHHVDLVRWLCDSEVVSVQASTWPVREGDEASVLQLQLASGVRAQLFVAHGTVEEDRVEVYGESGKLAVSRYDSLRVRRTTLHASGGLHAALHAFLGELRGIPYALEKRRFPGHEPSHAASMVAFIEAVRSGGRTSPDLYDGRAVQQVLLAARASASRGQAVEVVTAAPRVSGEVLLSDAAVRHR